MTTCPSEVAFTNKNKTSEVSTETLKRLAKENSYAHFTITREGNAVLLKAVRRVRVET